VLTSYFGAYNNDMARPKKSPQDLKRRKLVIPLTSEEMERIAKAGAIASSSGHTGWARDTLLKAADDLLRPAKARRAVEPKD
jgi:hypothetical protein